MHFELCLIKAGKNLVHRDAQKRNRAKRNGDFYFNRVWKKHCNERGDYQANKRREKAV